MTLQLHLTPELEALVRSAANSAGEDVETFVLRAVRERVGSDKQAGDSLLSDDEWQSLFQEWLAARKPCGHYVDDSRESIYADRGL